MKMPGSSALDRGDGAPVVRDTTQEAEVTFTTCAIRQRHPRRPLIDVFSPPSPHDAWGIFAWHHMALYVRALG
jgi:hypothetical protein